MKKITFITVIALLAALFATPVMAVNSEKSNYLIGGLWNFTANIPETTLPSGSIISAAETGKFVINSKYDSTAGVEKIYTMIVSYGGTYTIDGKTVKIDPVERTIDFSKDPKVYTPGEPIVHVYEQPVEGVTYKEVIKFLQTGENKLAGKMELYVDGKCVASGTLEATRPTWKLVGKWNYTSKINGTCPTIGDVSAIETGTMDMKMKSGDIAGKEYFDTLDVKYKATYNIGGTEETKEDEVKGIDISQAGLYNVGGLIYNEYKNTYGKVEHTQRIEFYQVEENKMTGKVYMIIGDQKTEIGTFEATRNTDSGSSGGCNAGATAAMLLFCAVPMLFRRKK